LAPPELAVVPVPDSGTAQFHPPPAGHRPPRWAAEQGLRARLRRGRDAAFLLRDVGGKSMRERRTPGQTQRQTRLRFRTSGHGSYSPLRGPEPFSGGDLVTSSGTGKRPARHRHTARRPIAQPPIRGCKCPALTRASLHGAAATGPPRRSTMPKREAAASPPGQPPFPMPGYIPSALGISLASLSGPPTGPLLFV
jgi:hypothetical protein